MGPDSPLELEESQLFGEESDVEEAPLDMSCRGGTAFAADTAAAAFSADASASDDDGIVLESECSSSDESEDAEQDLVDRLRSLQSSLEHTSAPLRSEEGPLGTSHSSHVGSLKSFGAGLPAASSSGMDGFAAYHRSSKRLFGSSPNLAASVPAHMHHSGGTAPMFAAGRRRVAPAADKSAAALRRGSGKDLAGDSGGRGDLFVPPHMLSRQEGEESEQAELGPAASVGGLGLSPTTAAKRERLLARNAILRSTGFIEVQHSAAVIGEVLDPVKDQLLSSLANAVSSPVAMPGSGRAPPRSSLSQLLGTSK
ncbi:hypothetical protein COHA_008938 [Chlorella ohadii]|uniref:Uncharacterized protein n=1 Tax=Chlorella ohadii TaxID=2649997 RepID=A0AAD5DGI4_9CHLO|nr:hypothetical protein COHA_008938 [Chlorella ohadii]